jgi:hypothetical protein
MATVYYDSSATGAGDGTSEADAYTDLQTALNSLSAGDHLYCKRAGSREGVKTTNLTFTTSATTGGPTIIEGYETTPGDGGMYQTASPVLITGEHVLLKYFDVDKDDDSTDAIQIIGDCSVAYRCKATSTYSFGNCFAVTDAAVIECAAYAVCSGSGDGCFQTQRGWMVGCYAEITDGANGAAITLQTGFRPNACIGCVCNNSGTGTNNSGIEINGSNNLSGNVIANNTIYNFANGIVDTEGARNVHSSLNIFYGNLLYSVGNGIINSQGTNVTELCQYNFANAYGSVTTAQTTNLSNVDDHAVTLTSSPFIDTTDFRLNNDPNGGALLKGLLGPPDIKDLESALRVSFSTHGAMTPRPLAEIARSL